MLAAFPQDLRNILETHHAGLDAELREKIVGSLVMLRNKDIIDSTTLLNTLFPILVQTGSKTLRAFLLQKILSDLRASNAKTTNHKLNRNVQSVLYNLIVSDRTSPKGLWAVKITREMWKRQIWTDVKAVEIMKEASLAENEKVISGGVRFFLGGDKEREEMMEDESSDEETIDMGALKHAVGINKKTKKRGNELKKAAAAVKRKERKKNAPHILNFSALHLLHDPQGFAETLFSKHLQPSKSKLSLDTRLAILQLVTRLIGLHKLILIKIYSWFNKYLTPKQQSVTTFLACLAQATHSLVPPEDLEKLVQKIANEFVSEASASEVAAAGLNSIREICVRQPLVMNDTLLQDLVMYKKSKDKGVMMAAKGLLSLYREVGAELLRKRDRGKDATIGLRSGEQRQARFGETAGDGGIEGIELLEAYKEEEMRKKREELGLGSDDELDDAEVEKEEAEGWKNWDVSDDDSSSDSGGWIDVESDGDEAINISDSEDEDKPRPTKKAKLDGAASSPSATTPAATSTNNDIDDTRSIADSTMSKTFASLATTRILTPADLTKLRELQSRTSILNAMPSNKRRAAALQKQADRIARHADEAITSADIEAAASLGKKSTKEEKIAMAKGDREERNQHKSTAAKRKQKKVEEGKSTTNKEKERAKNFLMTLGKAKRKNRRGLGDVRKALKGHVDRQKRGGRRGNK